MSKQQEALSQTKLSRLLSYFGLRFSVYFFGLGLSFCYTYTTQRLVVNDVGGIFQVVQYLGTALSCFIFFLLVKRRKKNFSTHRVLLFLCPLSAGLTALLLIAPNPLQNSNFVSLFFGAISGVFIGWLYLMWGSFFKMLDIKPAIWCIFGTLILASFVKMFVTFLSSDLLGAFVCASFPVLSTLFWWKSQKNPPLSKQTVERFSTKTLYTLKNLGFGVILFSFAIGLFMSMSFQVFSLPKEFSLVAHLITIAVSASAVVMAHRWREDFEFSNLWFIVLLTAASGLVIVGFSEGSVGFLSLATFTAAQMFVIAFYYLTLSDVAHNSLYPSDLVFGAGWALYALCMGLGFLPIHLVSPTINHLAVSLSVLYLLLIALFFFMRVRQPRELRLFADLNPAVTGDSLTQLASQTDTVASKHGLSEREKEVVFLYAQGRNRVFISHTLYISENTVRDHLKNVYRKMKIHSKQELIDAIQKSKLET